MTVLPKIFVKTPIFYPSAASNPLEFWQKRIIPVSFEERGIPFKRPPTQQKTESIRPRTSRPSSSPQTFPTSSLVSDPFLPPCLIGSAPKTNFVEGKTPQSLRIISLPRIGLLRLPTPEHGLSILTIKDLAPVSIAGNVRHPVLDVVLSENGPALLRVAPEGLPVQLPTE